MEKVQIQSKFLEEKDKVILVAPAGAVDKAGLDSAIRSLKRMGFIVEIGGSCTRRMGYLAGEDYLRAADIMQAFMDPSIAGIFCIKGGYGSQRILPMLNYELISANPKFFAGYSDITALHIAINQICGLITYHMPMPSKFEELDYYSEYRLNEMLHGKPSFIKYPRGHMPKSLVAGSAEGILCGGNLSILSTSLGTPYEIDTKGKILFIEEVGEEPYRIDRMLIQLRLAKKFEDAAGVIFGSWTDCKAEEPEKSLSLMDILKGLRLKIPAIYDFPCGHSLPTACLPLGAMLRMEGTQITLH